MLDLEMLPDKLPTCWREFYKKAFELAAKVDAIRAEKAANDESKKEKQAEK